MTNKLLSSEQVMKLIADRVTDRKQLSYMSLPTPVKIPFSNVSYWLKSDVERWITRT